MIRTRCLRRLTALLLLLCLALSLCPTAFAAESYEKDQVYREKSERTEVYTVRVYSKDDKATAVDRRDRMLRAGFDSFVYRKDDRFYVMCGKFRSEEEAQRYCALIGDFTDRGEKAKVVRAYVPQSALERFEEVYAASDPEISLSLKLAPNSYPADQVYKYKASRTKVFTVQVSSGYDRRHADERRDGLLAQGYDAFVYRASGAVYVMSGKFRTMRDALAYAESIHAYTSENPTAFVVNAWVPEKAIDAFEDIFYSSCLVRERNRDVETYWERPTGAFYRARTEGYTKVFTVQFSAGTSFHGSERNRASMEAQGYPAFVYKRNLQYQTMTGMFFDKASADAYCAAIRANTDQDDAFVTMANVPWSAITEFQSWWKG